MYKKLFCILTLSLLSSAFSGETYAQEDTRNTNTNPAENSSPTLPGTRSIQVEALTGLRFDNNAFVDRRGQFGADAVTHIVGLVSLSSIFNAQLTKWLEFSMESSVEMEELRIDMEEKSPTDDLRKTSVGVDPSLVFKPLTDLEISFKPSLQIVRESDETWSFLQTTPSVEAAYITPCGLHASLSYTFTSKFFDSNAPTDTYGNVDMNSHRGELSLKFWPLKMFRLRLGASIDHQTYDKNIGENLGRIVFLPIEQFENPDAEYTTQKRSDWNIQSEAEVLYVPFSWGLVAGGYRYEEVSSQFDPFTYRGHGPRLALAALYKGHEAYLEGKLTFKDFYDFRFDTRFDDTRKDYKLDLYAAYGYVIKPWVRLDLIYSFLRNDSNDAQYFEFGHSRSYSLYQRSKIELTATFKFDFLHKPEESKRPDIPGTIIAQSRGKK